MKQSDRKKLIYSILAPIAADLPSIMPSYGDYLDGLSEHEQKMFRRAAEEIFRMLDRKADYDLYDRVVYEEGGY